MTIYPRYFGAIEAGGTKFRCAVGDATGTLLEQRTFDTREPAATLADVVDYLRAARSTFGLIESIGIGAFGPVDINPASPRYGRILSTPKPGWSDVDLLAPLKEECLSPIRIDTDVNAAAIGEARWGGARDLQSSAYVTVGTGIGVGVIHHGRPVHGVMHPEAGHIRVLRHPADEEFAGICPFHGDCLEGLISGAAIVARTGGKLSDAGANHVIWDLVCDYLGQLCATLVLTHSPQRIALGGGVIHPRLLPGIRERARHWLNGYPAFVENGMTSLIAQPGLGTDAGIKGALAMALYTARRSVKPQPRVVDATG